MPDSKTIEVLMPSMGEGVLEATLIKWLKKKGEIVTKGEPLLEVSTDKVDTEIPAPDGGLLAQLVAAEGDVIQVGQVVALIGDDVIVSTPSTPKKAQEPEKSQPIPAAPAVTTSKNEILKKTSPLVRKMALDRGFSPEVFNQFDGSGLHGKITKNDFLNFVQTVGSKRLPQNRSTDNAVKTATNEGVETLDGVPIRREKMTKMRRLIAEHMVSSVRTSPHVTTVFEIDMHHVSQYREQHKKAFEAREGCKLTFTAFLIHAAVRTIKEFPMVNSSVDGDDILLKDEINMGCAVALETGLIVPVIKHAQELNLEGVARKLEDLVTRARSKKLNPDEVQGGTFSITNPGGWGSILSNPIINQPQVAILSIGNIVKRPVVIDDMIAIRPMMYAGLTFDHRVIDGEGGSKFLARFKQILENFNGGSE